MDALPGSDFDPALAATQLARLGIAFLAALPIAWNREHEERTLGLRTFPIVAMASAGYVMIAQSVVGSDDALARIFQGLMTGIGFLGGGAIIKQGASVRGTATAASLWMTAAVGAAVALRRYEIALTLVAVTYASLRWLKPVKPIAQGENRSDD